MANSSPDTLRRQWQLLRMIPRFPGKITATEMRRKLENEQFSVTKRTVERDLQALSAVFPLMSDDRNKPFGWSWLPNAVNFNIPGLSDNEALTLVMVEQHLKMLLPTTTLTQLQPYFKSARQHLDQIACEGNIRSWLDKVRAVPPAQPLLPAQIDEEIQQSVYSALLADRQIEISYLKRGADELRQYRLHPLALVQRGPVSYLYCLVNSDDRPRTFAMHRIRSAQVLTDQAKIPADFSIDTLIASGELGFGEGRQIHLEAVFQHGAGDHLFETPVSANQVLAKTRDSKLRLKATVADTQQLVWWLLGFGGSVEIIKPLSLRKRMAEEIETMSGVYKLDV
jgi:predicted DNA-binding transcriptional regulator YafY